jgi:predicted RNA polymerase sigma factor
MNEQVAEVAAQARRELSGRVLAATLRSVRDLDIAEESTADAFLLALQSWPTPAFRRRWRHG